MFRRVMGRFASGVTIITAESRGVTRGMTATAFMSGSLTPPLCIISIGKHARMHPHLIDAGRFGVNILAVGQEDISAHFSGRPRDGLDVPYTMVGGIPTIDHTCARITAHVAATHDCGDHTLFIGHILTMEADDQAPLLYHAGQYASIVHKGRPVPEGFYE